MNNALSAMLAIVGGIIGLATLSVILSPRAQTSNVVMSTGGALSTVIRAAVSPVNEANGLGGVAGFGGGSAFDVGDALSLFKTGSSLFT